VRAQLGAAAAAVFLSLRYHLLHPDYAASRLRGLQRAFRLSLLLVHVDVEDPAKPLADVTRAAIAADVTLVCAFSAEECARCAL
jgi:DNA excision repair protein ERCC-1